LIPQNINIAIVQKIYLKLTVTRYLGLFIDEELKRLHRAYKY